MSSRDFPFRYRDVYFYSITYISSWSVFRVNKISPVHGRSKTGALDPGSMFCPSSSTPWDKTVIRYSNVKDTVFYVTLAEFGHGARCFRVQDQDLGICQGTVRRGKNIKNNYIHSYIRGTQEVNTTPLSATVHVRAPIDFLEVLRFSFPVPVVGPSDISRSLLPQKT